MAMTLLQVDAFSDRPFRGNPAAVCVLSEPREDGWLQSVAAEMNLSETAFLWQREGGFQLRWFTPALEVDLCGHATLASAHALWELERVPSDRPIAFYTRSGKLTAQRAGQWIELDFPAEPESPADPPANLTAALGVAPRYIGRNRFDYLVELDSPKTLRTLEPDFRLLGQVPTRGIIVTSRSDSSDYDFLSRFFAPGAGIDEDPVTGSAHCCLGPFWSARLAKTELVGYQASRRGGVVRVRHVGDRVLLGGQAVTVLRGELMA